MNNKGFYPTSFAYPYGAHTPELDEALLNYFDFVRATAHSNQSRPIKDIDSVFYTGCTGHLIYGVGIDNIYNNPLSEIEEAMDRALDNDEILILYAHRPSRSLSENRAFEILTTLYCICQPA